MNALDELKQAALYAATDAQRQAFLRVHDEVSELIDATQIHRQIDATPLSVKAERVAYAKLLGLEPWDTAPSSIRSAAKAGVDAALARIGGGAE